MATDPITAPEQMREAPARIMAWPDYPDGWMTGSWSTNQYHTDLAVPYIRADLSDALIREAVEALERTRSSMCEGFCRDLPTFATHERSMDNDCAVCHLRPTLAKMKECFPNGI